MIDLFQSFKYLLLYHKILEFKANISQKFGFQQNINLVMSGVTKKTKVVNNQGQGLF